MNVMNSYMGFVDQSSSIDALRYQSIDPLKDLGIGYARNIHDVNSAPSFPMDSSDQQLVSGCSTPSNGMEKIQAISLLGCDQLMRETIPNTTSSYQELLMTDKIWSSLPLEPPLTTYQDPKEQQMPLINGDQNDRNNLYSEFVNMNRRCLSIRRRQIKQPNVIKGQWTLEEDGLLEKLVRIYGLGKWAKIASRLKGRVGKQCRERWHNHLKPNIKKENWSEEEDKILIQSHMQIGNRWAEIARRIPGRTENSIKNHWNATKRRQFARRRCNNNQPVTLLQTYIKGIYSVEDPNQSVTDVAPPSHALVPTSDVDVVNSVPAFYDLEDIARFLMDDGQQTVTDGFVEKKSLEVEDEIDLLEMLTQMNVNGCNGTVGGDPHD